MSSLIEKRSALSVILEAIKAKQAEIDAFEYSCSESEYDDWLDECHSNIEVAGCTFTASQILKECDPTAYRCGKVDYENGKDLDDVPEYVAITEELEELENERYDLECEIEDLEENEE